MIRALTVLLLGVAGCSSEVWVRPGTTLFQFSQDKAHCTEQSAIKTRNPPAKGKKPKVDEEKFQRCMEALGYERTSESSTAVWY